MSATYEVRSYYASNPSYRITGVGKVRFRGEYLWFWDDDDRVLLVERFYNQGIVERADVDAAASDEDVIEVIWAPRRPGPMSWPGSRVSPRCG